MDVPVDLRSDTVTRPTEAMRRAMADAEVGDDGYGEDPTVRRLEEAFAARVGKEAAVFVPSGTMGNQIALRLLGRPGTAVVAGRRQHVVVYEQGGAGGQRLDPVPPRRRRRRHDRPRRRAPGWWPRRPPLAARQRGLSSRTPTCRRAACPWPLERLRRRGRRRAAGLPVHLDGARLFNAEVATGVAAAEYAAPATTVMCCLSKGLAAPVGSMLAGPGDIIEAARLERKRLGRRDAPGRRDRRRRAGGAGDDGRPAGRRPRARRTAGRGRRRAMAGRRARPGHGAHQLRRLPPPRTRPGCSTTWPARASWPAASPPEWSGS